MTDTKQRILQEALKLFSQSGYKGTSMNDIASQLNVTKAALYRHYKSKQEILDSIVKKMNELDRERAQEYDMPDGTLEDVVHETLFSFASKSPDEFVSKKMTIYLYPAALSEANVTWESLCNYMDWQCSFFGENQRHITTSKAEGNPISKQEKVTTK